MCQNWGTQRVATIFSEAIQAVPELGQGIRDPYEVAIDKPHSLPNIRFAKV